MAGKGSAPRPIPNRKQYEQNYDAIFGHTKLSEYKTKFKKCGKCGLFFESEYASREHDYACNR